MPGAPCVSARERWIVESTTLAPPSLTLASRPYSWPYHGRFAPLRAALLVVVGDTSAVPEPHAVESVAELAAELRGSGGHAILLPTLTAIAQPFDVSAFDAVVDRPSPGGFTGSSLGMVLRKLGCSDLIFAGFPFEIGADCTMRQANDLGFECLALEDCSSAVADDTFTGAMSSIMMSGGIFGAVALADDVRDLIQRWRAHQVSA